MSTVVSKGVNGQIELTNKDGEPVGTVDLSLSFEEGDGMLPYSLARQRICYVHLLRLCTRRKKLQTDASTFSVCL